MSKWITTKDKLPKNDRGYFDVKFRNGKIALATFDELDDERPFCPVKNGKYSKNGYPKCITIMWRNHDTETSN